MSIPSLTASSSSKSVESRDILLAKKRITHNISFKLDVCNYLRKVSASVTSAANFFGISRKQVRNFRDHEELYRLIRHRRLRRNCIKPSQVRLRAKFFEQEQNLHTWFTEARHNGTFF